MASSQDETAAADDVSATPRDPLGRVLEMVRFLRANCPWDAEQTPRSLLPYLLEEAHEVAHHVEDEDDPALAAELGDLLLHVAFQIVLAEERAAFAADDVADRVVDKMRRRHPHLFGLGEAREWEVLKAEERAAAADARGASPAQPSGTEGAPASLLDGMPAAMDPLASAHRIQDRVSAVGFDWDDPRGAFEKVREEIDEVGDHVGEPVTAATETNAAALEEEIGDLLFAVVNFARLSGVHAGLALGAANRKFARRFRALEQLAPERDVRLGEASLAELDDLWDEVKRNERGG